MFWKHRSISSDWSLAGYDLSRAQLPTWVERVVASLEREQLKKAAVVVWRVKIEYLNEGRNVAFL